MRIFWEKNCKNRLSVGGSGGWGLCSQTPRCYSRLLLQLCRVCFLCLMHFIMLKKEPSNYSKYFAFASSVLLLLFLNSNSVNFFEGGRKNISCPRAQDTLATPLSNIIVVLHHKQHKRQNYLLVRAEINSKPMEWERFLDKRDQNIKYSLQPINSFPMP